MKYLISLPVYSYKKDDSNVFVTFGKFVLKYNVKEQELRAHEELCKRQRRERKELVLKHLMERLDEERKIKERNKKETKSEEKDKKK